RTRALEILTRDHADSDKIGPVCQRLSYSADTASEQLLRAVLEKNPKQDVQGTACLVLGEVLKNQAEAVHQLKGKEQARQRCEQYDGKEQTEQVLASDPAKLRKEAEGLFERVIAKYGDVKHGQGDLGKAAEGQLFELRHLAVGKEAPDIEGEDI